MACPFYTIGSLNSIEREHSQAGALDSARGTKQDGIHAFVQSIVDLFEQQRRERKFQFTVLFLSSLPLEEISATNMIFRTQTGVVSTPEEATDCFSPTFPPDDHLCNYITARPRGNHHAEVWLMDKLDLLLSTYKSLGMPQCRSIVLYTWLLPCMNCMEYISRRVQDYVMSGLYKVTVVYTSKQRGLEDEEIAKIQSGFEVAGVEVLYEPYDQYLKPAPRH